MKATSLFGGVQVINIIIQIIKSKFVAILLGPAGMGIVGLLTSSIGFIGSLTNFGLGTSAVRDVSAAHATGNQTRIATVIAVLRRWVWLSGLLGSLLVLVLSPYLSQLTFGNRDYSLAFVWISITLLLNQLSVGQRVVLQGMRKLKQLAKANVAGSFLGLCIAVPLYYWKGLDAIVPVIIITSVTALLISWFYASRIKTVPVRVGRLRTLAEGKTMVRMGFMISLSGLITVGASYIVRIFISHTGGIEQVGLYTAGFAIITTYVGLVLNAMGTDYYPRLSAVANNQQQCNQTINQQAEISLLILAPIIIVFLVFIKWVVVLLYSDKFVAVDVMIHWAALGMLFRAASWAIAFVFLAKGASKLFFWNELVVNLYMLVLNLAGYYFYGLNGLGISFLISYLLYLLQVFYLSRKYYGFSFNRAFKRIFALQTLLVVGCFLVMRFTDKPFAYIWGSLFLMASVLYSFNELNKRLNLRTLYSKTRK